MKSQLLATLVTTICLGLPASAHADGPELAGLDATAMEPQTRSLSATFSESFTINTVVPRTTASAPTFAGIVNPSIGVGIVLWQSDAFALATNPTAELTDPGAGYDRRDVEWVLPLSWTKSWGPLSLNSQLGYHALFGPDEWTLDSSLSLDLAAVDAVGWSVFINNAAASDPNLDNASSLWSLGGSLTHGDLTLLASIGEGIRDQPFADAERFAFIAFRTTL